MIQISSPSTKSNGFSLSGSCSTSLTDGTGGVSSDEIPPVALIDSPADAMEVSAPVDVIGTASDPNLLRWDLSISQGEDEARTVIATGTTPVTDGVLAELDPTLLMNGLYVLILEVFDRGGNVTEARSTVEVDGDLKVGNFTISQDDLVVPLPGFPVNVVRTYDSRDKARGDFGIGWQLALNSATVSTTRTLGTGWDVVGGGRSYALSPNDDHMVSVTLPDGEVHTFRMQVTPSASFFRPTPFGLRAPRTSRTPCPRSRS